MIEGGNLGVFSPEEVGPMNVQVPNGTVDIAVFYTQSMVDLWGLALGGRIQFLVALLDQADGFHLQGAKALGHRGGTGLVHGAVNLLPVVAQVVTDEDRPRDITAIAVDNTTKIYDQ